MLRRAASLLLLPLIFSGCALCTNCEDENYSAYGGRWEREMVNHGRVGSAFEPAGHLVDGGDFIVGQPTPAVDADDAHGDDAGSNAAGDDDAGEDEAGEDEAGEDEAGEDDAGEDDAGGNDEADNDAG